MQGGECFFDQFSQIHSRQPKCKYDCLSSDHGCPYRNKYTYQSGKVRRYGSLPLRGTDNRIRICWYGTWYVFYGTVFLKWNDVRIFVVRYRANFLVSLIAYDSYGLSKTRRCGQPWSQTERFILRELGTSKFNDPKRADFQYFENLSCLFNFFEKKWSDTGNKFYFRRSRKNVNTSVFWIPCPRSVLDVLVYVPPCTRYIGLGVPYVYLNNEP